MHIYRYIDTHSRTHIHPPPGHVRRASTTCPGALASLWRRNIYIYAYMYIYIFIYIYTFSYAYAPPGMFAGPLLLVLVLLRRLGREGRGRHLPQDVRNARSGEGGRATGGRGDEHDCIYLASSASASANLPSRFSLPPTTIAHALAP